VAEWQTRRIQNPVAARSCGFKSHLRYWFGISCAAGVPGELFAMEADVAESLRKERFSSRILAPLAPFTLRSGETRDLGDLTLQSLDLEPPPAERRTADRCQGRIEAAPRARRAVARSRLGAARVRPAAARKRDRSARLDLDPIVR
jgi:hypothetical protein